MNEFLGFRKTNTPGLTEPAEILGDESVTVKFLEFWLFFILI